MSLTLPKPSAILDRRLPWWTWPAQLVGVLAPPVRLAAARDAATLAALGRRLPSIPPLAFVLGPAAVIVIAALIGLLDPGYRMSTPNRPSSWSWR